MPPRKAPASDTARTTRATLATKTNTRKRAASPEQSSATKKPASGKKENKAAVTTKKPASRAKPSKAAAKRREEVEPTVEDDTEIKQDSARPRKRVKKEVDTTLVDPVVPEKAINQLPTPAAHTRPPAQLFFWGAGNFGQFGMGPDALGEFDKPRRHTWVEAGIEAGNFGDVGAGIECAAAGGMHTMFIDEVGRVWTCGVNDDAALGRPIKDVPDPENEGKFLDVDTLMSYPHPIKVLEEEEFRAVRLSAGDNIGAALSDKGSLRVWGTFKSKEGALGFSSDHKHQWQPIPVVANKLSLNRPEALVDVACGSNHILALTASGDVYAWGDGEHGQLGRKVLERTKIHGVTPERVVIGSRTRRFKTLGAAFCTSFAVDTDGEVWAWGLNNKGQTGTNTSYDEEELVITTPRVVEALSPEKLNGERVIQITGGEHHSVFLTSGGRVFACGRAEGGQLGLSDNHPAMVERKALLKGASVDVIITPSEITFATDASTDPIIRVETGVRNNLAISRDGALYSWGEGNQGELGLGEDETNANTPGVVVRRTGGAWSAVGAACGGQHTIGVFRKKKTD